MNRRGFLKAAAGGLVVLIGAGVGVYSQVPVIPNRPEPDPETALGWISYADGRYRLTLPRAEMGQNIATGLKQIACAELGADWDTVEVGFHDTTAPAVKATVGSESIMLFAEPLAQACASLRDAIDQGRDLGEVTLVTRPVSELRSLQKGGLIGASPGIEQGMGIVTGQPLYAADVTRPDMLYGRVLHAPASVEVGSRPLRWNTAAAQAVPGFVALVEDTGPSIGQSEGLGIVATRPGALDAIAQALAVEWQIDGDHARADVMSAIDVDTHLAGGALRHTVRDDDPAPGRWDVDLRIDVPLAAHGPIEPRAAVAEWADGTLRVWAGTQDAFYVRDVLSSAFGLDPDAVVVQTARNGGAFGGRVICTVEAEAAALARAVGTPVKIQWTRAQEFALGYHRPPASHRVKARIVDGKLTDWNHAQVSSHIFFTSGVVPQWMQRATDRFAGDDGVARGMAAPYQVGRAKVSYDVVRLPVHTASWRGLGAGPNALAIESAMDEAGLAAGVDPLDFRLAHIDDPLLAGVLNRVAELSSWGAVSGEGQNGVRQGRGIAAGVYKKTSYAAAVADVSVDRRGNVQVDRMWCVHDCGLVMNPDQVRAQCEGNLVWGLGMILTDDLPLADGHVVAETFGDAPIPSSTQVPPMVIDLLESDRPPQGAGETAIVAGPGAIANAVRAATGIRPQRFPITRASLVL
ncbi:MAG: xanthine dehydrogenase family protein molybdopterin-binding subunit [Rhodobacteraceae bacterium]|nr:xanthine dehydrogenase family protein molybdopterin-binding subunit [Paracoccaceae bacterium]